MPPLIPGVQRKHVPPMAPPPPRPVPLRPRFESKPALPAKARKVRGGERLPDGDVARPEAWAAQRWLRFLEQMAPGPSMVLGMDYAREGQTKRWSVLAAPHQPTRIEAAVQGRAPRPYATTLTFQPITPEQWEQVVAAMSDNAMYAAKLLAGELPTSIEDVFGPLGVRLFPTDAADVQVACNCDFVPERSSGAAASGWCKHATCVGLLLAHRLANEPFLMFSLRGLEHHDLVERLRARRQVVGAALGATPIYQQRVPNVSDVRSAPLEQSLASFWDLGDTSAMDLTPTPPAVSHPLLRRLGPSPWASQAQFPLVGLLASCYDTIGTQAQAGAQPSPPAGEEPSK